MKRRILSFIGALTLFIFNITVFAIPVYAAGESEKELPKGYWKLVSVETKGPDSQFDNAHTSGSNGHYTCTAECTDSSIKAYHDGKNLTSCAGEHITINIDVEEPPSIIIPGKEVALKVSPSFSGSSPHDSLLFYACHVYVDYAFGGYNSDGHFYDSKKQNYLGIDRTWQYDDYYAAAGLGNHFYVIESDNVLRHTFDRSASKMWIRIGFGHGRGEDGIDTYYNYEWIADREPPAAGQGQEQEQEEETDGYWELVETEIPAATTNTASDYPQTKTVTTFADGSAKAVFTADADIYNSDGALCFQKGDTVTASLAYEKPKRIYKPYEVISLKFNGTSDIVKRDDPLKNMFVGIGAGISVNSGYIDKSGDDTVIKGGRSKKFQNTNGNSTVGTGFYNPVREGLLSGLAPDKNSDDPDSAAMWITVDIINSDSYSYMEVAGAPIIYKYQWRGGKAPAGAATENNGSSTDSGNGPVQKISQLVVKDADNRPGEDGGTSVVPAIVIGVSTVGAAVGAGAAASSASKNKKNNEENKDERTYKMYIRKDFGDTIQKGAPPVRVYARIESSGGGSVIRETMLSSHIEIFTETQGVSVAVIGVVGDAKCAEITIPDKKTEITECIIVFRYRGKGGVFTEKVRFKVGATAVIEFVCPREDGTYKVMAETNRTFRALLGPKEPLGLYIRLKDFAEDAESIDPVCPSGSSLSVKVVRTAPFIYRLDISNSTPMKRFGTFPAEHRIDITAKTAKGQTAGAVLTMQYYPYGVYADTSKLDQSMVKENYIEIQTCEFTDDTMTAFRPTLFQMYFADWGEEDDHEAVVTDISQVKLHDCKIVSAVQEHDKLISMYKYELTALFRPPYGIRFTPIHGLLQPDPKTEYICNLKVAHEHRYDDKVPDFEGSIPVRLLGKPKNDAALMRTEEISEIQRLVAYFKLQDEEDVKQLLSNIDNIPTDVLHKQRLWIYDLGTELQQKEFESEQAWARAYDIGIKVAATVRWVDDLAFSAAVKYIFYAKGMNGEMADAIISPLKDLLFDSFGEATAKYFWGEWRSGFSYKKLIMDKLETTVNNMLWTEAGKVDSPKKAAFLVVLAAIMNAEKAAVALHDEYISQNKDIDADFFWKVTCAVCANMTANGVKSFLAGRLINNGSSDQLEYLFKVKLPWKQFLKTNCSELLTKSFISADAASAAVKELAKTIAAETGLNTVIDSVIGTSVNYANGMMDDEKEIEIPIIGDDVSFKVKVDRRTAWTFVLAERDETMHLNALAKYFNNSGIILPDKLNDMTRDEILDVYRRLGYGEELRFLTLCEIPSPVDRSVFADGAERPTMDIGTDWHKYAR
ncbi:MAG: hypothetical protein II820_01390 [Ruminiclostridium sp.]|nr:hypothetical protein [Ruminiclostridium sp.]